MPSGVDVITAKENVMMVLMKPPYLYSEAARHLIQDLVLIKVFLSLPTGFVGITDSLPQLLQSRQSSFNGIAPANKTMSASALKGQCTLAMQSVSAAKRKLVAHCLHNVLTQ